MKLIDTHAHLQFEAYDKDRDEVVKRNSARLDALVNVGAKIDSSEAGVALAQKVDNFYAAVGVHPHHVDEWDEDWINRLEKLARNPKVVAIGEIGLDQHEYQGFPKPNLKKQKKILASQIELAQKLDLPILFHCRKAYDELFDLIKNYNNIKGLVHCFMGTQEQANDFLNLGLYISFSGNITYKGNDYIRDVAKKIPEDKILVETDAPFLPPEGHRGARNEPIYVKLVAEAVSRSKGWPEEKTTQITSSNAKKLLDISL